jgi:hypothetical protein
VRRSAHHEFLSGLLDSPEGRKRIGDIWDELTQKRLQRVGQVECPRCKEMKNVDVELEVYKLKDVIAFLGWAATFGIGKPPDERNVNVNITARRLEEMSDEQLDAIIDARELAPVPD